MTKPSANVFISNERFFSISKHEISIHCIDSYGSILSYFNEKYYFIQNLETDHLTSSCQ